VLPKGIALGGDACPGPSLAGDADVPAKLERRNWFAVLRLLLAGFARSVWAQDRSAESATAAVSQDGNAVRAEQKFQTLVEQLPAITYIVEIRGLKPRAIYVSPQIESILGYSQDEWLSDPSLSYRLLHPNDRDDVMSRVMANLETREPFILEYRKVAKDGRVVWFRNHANWIAGADGRQRRVQGVMIDITQRKAAEEAMRRRDVILQAVRFSAETCLQSGSWSGVLSEVLEKLAVAIGASRSYVVSLGMNASAGIEGKGQWSAEGVEPKWNGSAASALAGLLPLHRLEQLARNEVHAGRVENLEAAQRDLLEAQGVLSIALAPIHVGGFLWGVLGLEDCQGAREWSPTELDALRAVAHHLAAAIERERGELALRHQETRLRQSQKMEALGRLAGGVAHDFNNLLTSILGYTRIAKEDLRGSDTAQDDLDEVIRCGERAAELTHRLLTFGRHQIVHTRPLNLNRVVDEMDRILRRTLGEDVELVTLFGEDLGWINGDSGQLHQVVMNLAVNARDAMPQGGRLVIETGNADADEAYLQHHPDLKPGRYVWLSVTDTGTGMSEEVREKAFEPFFTTKEQGKGTGLGLATVYGVVRNMDGAVELRSRVGEGTQCLIHLPRVVAPREAEEGDKRLQPAPRGSETILLVEDESTLRALVRRYLLSLGYRVLEAVNGRDALRIAREYPGKLDLVLADIIMPQMGGPETVRELQAVRRNIRAVFMTGFPGDAIQRAKDWMQDAPVIAKPFTRESLAVSIRDALDR